MVVKDTPTADHSSVAAGRVCPKCGKKLPADVRFCTGCGNPMQETQPAPIQEQQIRPEPTPIQEQQIRPEPVPIQEQPARPEPAPMQEQPVRPESAPMQEQPVRPEPVLQTEKIRYEAQPPRNMQQDHPQKSRTGLKVLLIVVAIVGALLLFAASFLLTEYFLYGVSPADLLHRTIDREEMEDDMDKDTDEDDQGDSVKDEKEDARSADKEAEAVITEETAPAAEPTAEVTPEPSPEPTPVVWEDWDIDMDAEQADIDKWVKDYRNTRGHYKKYDYGDTYYYLQDGTPVIIGAKKDVNGWKYNREYLGVVTYYAELDDGYQSLQKFYYSGEKLFRVVDEGGIVHDYGCKEWEELNELGERLKEDRKKLLDDFD